MATLKYKKSRKNKKQLRKKKRTYKKRKTTRRKKGGYDTRDVTNIKDRFLDKDIDYPINSRLNFLEEAASNKHSGCTREYYTKGFSIEKYYACEKKKVEDYCAILIELNDMIEKLNSDNQMDTQYKELINNEFHNYKKEIETKVEYHMGRAYPQKNKNDPPITTVFMCDKLKLQQEKEQEP